MKLITSKGSKALQAGLPAFGVSAPMKSILTIFMIVMANVSFASETMTPLKESFQKVREQRNIDLVLPVLLKSELYVIVAETEPGQFEFFYTKSPQPDRFCVTVAESEDTLSSIKWPKRKITGEQLIRELPEAIEIIVTYKDGGDYITKEHLQWYREQMP
jgi:fimbrial chaperone protein